MKLGKVIIVDGSYLLHRALHVESIFELKNSYGERTGGIFQVLRSLNSEVNKNPGYYPLVTWDAGLSPRRLEVYPNYKRNLDRAKELNESLDKNEKDEYLYEYRRQRGELIDIFDILGIPSFRYEGWEGDDLMYILAKLTDDGIVLTDDKDLIQLLSPTVKVSRPMNKQLLEYNKYQETNNDPGMKKFVIVKAICGDPSDNIPKCADRVGVKTAEYIAELMIDSPDTWLDVLSESTKVAHKNFCKEESLAQFIVNMELVDLSKVEITQEIQKSIATSIATSVRVPNYFKFVTRLGEKEIHNLDVDGMVSNLTRMVSSEEVLICQ